MNFIADLKTLESDIKTFLMPFDIDDESMPIDVQMKFIELKYDLNLKAKFI